MNSFHADSGLLLPLTPKECPGIVGGSCSSMDGTCIPCLWEGLSFQLDCSQRPWASRSQVSLTAHLSCPEFHGLDEATLLRALQALQQEHKAEIITVSDGRGVKFF